MRLGCSFPVLVEDILFTLSWEQLPKPNMLILNHDNRFIKTGLKSGQKLHTFLDLCFLFPRQPTRAVEDPQEKKPDPNIYKVFIVVYWSLFCFTCLQCKVMAGKEGCLFWICSLPVYLCGWVYAENVLECVSGWTAGCMSACLCACAWAHMHCQWVIGLITLSRSSLNQNKPVWLPPGHRNWSKKTKRFLKTPQFLNLPCNSDIVLWWTYGPMNQHCVWTDISNT